jgi:hypothetical protein
MLLAAIAVVGELLAATAVVGELFAATAVVGNLSAATAVVGDVVYDHRNHGACDTQRTSMQYYRIVCTSSK